MNISFFTINYGRLFCMMNSGARIQWNFKFGYLMNLSCESWQ